MSNINHPGHYQGKYEVWDVLDEWFPASPLLWNVGKYLARADKKGVPLEDLKKAQAYLSREIERRERGNVTIVNGASLKWGIAEDEVGVNISSFEMKFTPMPQRKKRAKK